VPEVTLAHSPGHVGRRAGDHDSVPQRQRVHRIHLAGRGQGLIQTPPVSSSKSWRGIATELGLLAGDGAEHRRVPPVPGFRQPTFANQAKLSSRLDTFRIG
jgi:hypothetical protein